MESQLESLRIDRSQKRSGTPRSSRVRWIVTGLVVSALFFTAWVLYAKRNSVREVETMRVQPGSDSFVGTTGNNIVLNATGYIIAAHKIEVASKIVGRVAWIGVDKGDKVQAGQVLVRLEDEE